MYINGTLANPSSTAFSISIVDSVADLVLGAKSDFREKFKGYIDEVAIYSTALSAGAILAHYNAS